MVKVSQFRWTKERNINLKKELLVFLTIYFFNNYFDKNCDDNMDAFQSCSESASFGIVASILLYDFSKFNKFLKGLIDQCVKQEKRGFVCRLLCTEEVVLQKPFRQNASGTICHAPAHFQACVFAFFVPFTMPPPLEVLFKFRVSIRTFNLKFRSTDKKGIFSYLYKVFKYRQSKKWLLVRF